MDMKAQVHMEMLHLNLMMTADRDGRFDWLPEETKQQADVALWIRHDIKKATPEILSIMKKPDEFGYWAFHAKIMSFGKKEINPAKVFTHVSKALVASFRVSNNLHYMQSFTSAFKAVEAAGMDTVAFCAEFLNQALRAQNGLPLKFLFWKLKGDNGDHVRAQGMLLKAFQEKDGFRETLAKLLTKRSLGLLVIEHGLNGFVDFISRKDRGTVLSNELGI